jgi:hypothetical protein
MKKKKNLSSPEDQLAHLRGLNRREKLALFVGAGISMGCGLPDWRSLVTRLCTVAFKTRTEAYIKAVQRMSAVAMARLLRAQLKSDFNSAVASCLYREPAYVSSSLTAIAKSGVTRICSFNFDDLLEEAFSIESIEYNSRTPGEKVNNNFLGVIIFHPHGLLEHRASSQEVAASKIVFSEDDYTAEYAEPYSWSNLVQLSLLLNYTVLFVGMSMEDPNIRRLLDVIRRFGVTHQHFAILRSKAAGVRNADERRALKQENLVAAAELRSLGVEPLWVSDYDQIAYILKKVRVKRTPNPSLKETSIGNPLFAP